MSTGYLWNALYGWMDTGTGGMFPANGPGGMQPISHPVPHPDTKRRLHELVEVSGLIDHLDVIQPRPATPAELGRAHTEAHISRIQAESKLPKGGDAGDGVSAFGQGGYEIAALAAGGAIAMVDAVLDGRVDNGYALVNPPGHHAPRETGMGFCVFNNASVAAAHARQARGLSRVAILDWDVHHGNGTQSIWWDDPSVFTVSIHQDQCFPANSGLVEERGTGAGEGAALNIPLPPGGGNAAYRYAFDEVIAPALRAFQPELILVASGFDASIIDPMARMMLTADGFRDLTTRVLDLAEELTGGKVVFVQEGGYSPHYVPFCGLAVLETLSGVETGIEDGFAPVVSTMGGDVLLEHERALVDSIRSLIAGVPTP